MNIKTTLSPGVWLCFLFVVLAVLTRLAPHPPNFTPVGAIGLFVGSYIALRRYWIVPLLALLISDIFIGFYHPVTMISVYVAFFICAMIGRMVLVERRGILRLATTAFSASFIFFILSNFGDWLSGFNYPLTLEGLITCYVMAIPFFGNTVLGDLFYVALLFGIYGAVRLWMIQSQSMRAI